MRGNTHIIVSGAVIFKDSRGRRLWLVVKQGASGEEKWEIPKVTARKGESSVRASIRMMGEMAGVNARVLEEAGRSSGVASVNGKSIPQKLYYYLMVQRAASEAIGFQDYQWLEHDRAVKKLSLKREKDVLKAAKRVLRQWEKEGRE